MSCLYGEKRDHNRGNIFERPSWIVLLALMAIMPVGMRWRRGRVVASSRCGPTTLLRLCLTVPTHRAVSAATAQ